MKPETHTQLIDLAIKHLSPDITFSDVENGKLVEGVEKEDGKTASCGLNWHFYPANDVIAARRWILYPTSLRIMKKREARFLKNIRRNEHKEIFESLGRVIHHIQDMSTPTNVVPVYHSFWEKTDPFEDYLVDKWNVICPELVNDEQDNSSPESSFTKIYEHSGERLLDSLHDGNGLFPLRNDLTGKNITSEKFWLEHGTGGEKFKPPFNIKGFGGFGEYGIDYNNNSLDRTFNRVKVAAFFMSFALNDTIKSIKLFRKMYN